jgi:hypothetical protein
MVRHFYFLHYNTQTYALAVTEVNKHKFENTRGFESLTRPGGIPSVVRDKMDDMSKADPAASYRLFLSS